MWKKRQSSYQSNWLCRWYCYYQQWRGGQSEVEESTEFEIKDQESWNAFYELKLWDQVKEPWFANHLLKETRKLGAKPVDLEFWKQQAASRSDSISKVSRMINLYDYHTTRYIRCSWCGK